MEPGSRASKLEKLTHLPGIHLGLRYPWTKKINYMGTGKIECVSIIVYWKKNNQGSNQGKKFFRI
jgi:hypothetical protein